MTPEEKIAKARQLMFEATRERKDKEYKVRKKKEDNEMCRCGHKRKFHSDNYSVNYTGGFCSECNCHNFLGK